MEDLPNVGPPRRRKTNADLVRKLIHKDNFIKDVLEIREMPADMRQRGQRLLDDDVGGESDARSPQRVEDGES